MHALANQSLDPTPRRVIKTLSDAVAKDQNTHLVFPYYCSMTNYWSSKHETYREQQWVHEPSIFAQTAIQYFPAEGKVLELGAGQGQDTVFFAGHGYQVVSTDLEESALALQQDRTTEELSSRITRQVVDMREELPFSDSSFDVVYAHLSMHLFSRETTVRLLDEIQRVLKPGGVLAFMVNSVNDPEYAEGTYIEDGFVEYGGIAKRYFSLDATREFVRYFDITLLDDKGESYKDMAKGVHNLVRFIGNKPERPKYQFAIPVVGALIHRVVDGEHEVLLQTRWKPGDDPVYSGTFEFPIGKLDKPFENIFAALAREISEESGLVLKSIIGESRTPLLHSDRNDEVVGFRPFCCVQQTKNGKPWAGFIFLCEVEPGEPTAQLSEAKDTRWTRLRDVKDIFDNHKEQLFGLELPAWHYLFAEYPSWWN